MKGCKYILFIVCSILLFMTGAYAQSGFPPGSIVPEQNIGRAGVKSFFQDQAIPDTIFALMQGKSYKDDCTVPRSDLRYLLLLHRDLEGHAIVGEMVVNKQIAADVLSIMEQLFIESYPIEKVRLIDYFDADDEKSMSAPMNRSTPGLPVHHQLLEFTQTHVHRVGDAIQPTHPLSSPSPPAPNPSQHQSHFQ